MSLAAIFIAVPLLLAFLVPAFSKKEGRSVGLILPTVLSGLLAASVWVLLRVLSQGTINETIVIAPPLGINLVADKMSAILVILFTAVAWWNSIALLQKERKTSVFFSLYILHLAGLNTMILTQDLFNLFVFFEITSISAYVLTAWNRDGQAERKSLHYLLLGSVSSALFLIAIAFIYRHTGSLHMIGIAQVAAQIPLEVRFLILGLMLIAWGVEAEWFPLNSWVSGVYEASPGGVSTMMGSATVKASLIIFAKLMLILFPAGEALPYFVGFGVATLVVGELAALRHKTLLGTLGLGSAAQIGLLSMVVFNPDLKSAVFFHILSHSLAILILVGIAGAWKEQGYVRRDQLVGLARRNPWLGMAFTIAAFSAIGFPPFMGFVGKLAILQGLAASPILLGVVLLSALVEAWYLGSILIDLWKEPSNPLAHEMPRISQIALALPVIAIVVLGLVPAPLLQFFTEVDIWKLI